MSATTMSSREFNQDTGGAKRAARAGPVYITDRGRPAHVLLSFEDYERLVASSASMVELLSQPPGVEDIDLELPTPRDLARTARFD